MAPWMTNKYIIIFTFALFSSMAMATMQTDSFVCSLKVVEIGILGQPGKVTVNMNNQMIKVPRVENADANLAHHAVRAFDGVMKKVLKYPAIFLVNTQVQDLEGVGAIPQLQIGIYIPNKKGLSFGMLASASGDASTYAQLNTRVSGSQTADVQFSCHNENYGL